MHFDKLNVDFYNVKILIQNGMNVNRKIQTSRRKLYGWKFLYYFMKLHQNCSRRSII